MAIAAASATPHAFALVCGELQRRAGCLPCRLDGMSFISSWKNDFDLASEGREAWVGFWRSTFVRHMGQILLVTSECMAWCRHLPQNM